jgi:hypothetical protein
VDIILSLIAALLLLTAGLGIVLLVIPRNSTIGAIEAFSLSLLAGTSYISLASFAVGLVLPSLPLRLMVSAGSILLLFLGVRAKRQRRTQILMSLPRDVLSVVFTCILTAQIGVVIWLSFQNGLMWDGLFVWEFKARLAFLAGGTIPQSYFSDPTRVWSHPEYPLLVPMTEAWLYGWLGHTDQEMVKFIFPLFYIAAVGMLHAGGARLGRNRWRGFTAATLLFFVPLAVWAEGSATSGYADFPLAVFYLASVIYLLEYIDTGGKGPLRMAGIIAAILPWVKQEGILLWLCIVLILAFKAVLRQDTKTFLLVVCLPGVALVASWQTFLRIVHAPQGGDFLPLSLTVFRSNIGRIMVLSQWLGNELVNWHNWGLLWPAFAISLLSSASKRACRFNWAMAAVVVVPLLVYTGIYVFSALSPFMNHVKFSLPRLMLQTSLVAVLFVSLSLPEIWVLAGINQSADRIGSRVTAPN